MKLNLNFYILVLLSSYITINAETRKMPVNVSYVKGIMPREYQIVNTKILQDPAKSQDPDNKPIITRSIKGKVSSSSGSSYVNEDLSVPQLDINIETGAFPDMISKIAGTIDPRAGAVAAGASAVVDESLRIASNELNKKYKINKYTLNLIEILPSQYYRIDTATNTIKITDAFKTDLKSYNKLLKDYVPVAKAYNQALTQYQQAYTKWRMSGSRVSGSGDKNLKDAANRIYQNVFTPALKKKLAVESKLGTYGLHRISLMAVQGEPGEGCSSAKPSQGKGPWSLYLYYFIGAKQTNIFKIDYCVPSTGKDQKLTINLNPNFVNKSGNFEPGGVTISSNENISFPGVDSTGNTNFGRPSTQLYSWFDEMLVNKNADNIAIYMFPFDLYNLQAQAEKEKKAAQDEKMKKSLAKLDAALSEIKGAAGGSLGNLFSGGDSLLNSESDDNPFGSDDVSSPNDADIPMMEDEDNNKQDNQDNDNSPEQKELEDKKEKSTTEKIAGAIESTDKVLQGAGKVTGFLKGVLK